MSHQFGVHDIATLGSQGININDQELLEVAEADLGLVRREVVSTEQSPFQQGNNQNTHGHVNTHNANDWTNFIAPSDEDAKKLDALNNGQSHRDRLTAELTQAGGRTKFSGPTRGFLSKRGSRRSPSSMPSTERGVGKLRTKAIKSLAKVTAERVARVMPPHGLNLATDANAFVKATNLIIRTGPVVRLSSSNFASAELKPAGLTISKWAKSENVVEGVGEGVGESVGDDVEEGVSEDVDDSETEMTLLESVDRNDSPQLISFEGDGMMEELMEELSIEIARLQLSQYTNDLEDLDMTNWEEPPKLDSGCLSLLPVGDSPPPEALRVREPANDAITGHAQAENLQVRNPASNEITGNVKAAPDGTEVPAPKAGNVLSPGMWASKYAPANVKAAPDGSGILAGRSRNVLAVGMMASRYAPGNYQKRTLGVRRW